MIPNVKCIVIDDDHTSINRMEKLLSLIPETSLEFQSSFNENIFDHIKQINPHLIFIEIELHGKDGFEIINDLNKYNIKSKVVVTTTQSHYSIKAIKHNVFDFLLKPIDIDELKQTIKKIRTLPFQTVDYNRKENGLNELSHREQEVVTLLVKGKTSKEISGMLGITKNTVDTHRRKILEKTGLGSTLELIAKLK